MAKPLSMARSAMPTLNNASLPTLPSQKGWLACGTGLTGTQTRVASRTPWRPPMGANLPSCGIPFSGAPFHALSNNMLEIVCHAGRRFRADLGIDWLDWMFEARH